MTKPFVVAAALALFAALPVAGCHRDAGQHAVDAPPHHENVPPPPIATVEAAPDDLTAADKDPQRKIGQAVRDFVKETYPGSRVEGVWALSFTRNYCLAGADMTTGSQRRTVDLLVRLYVRQNGSKYWRAESLDRELVNLWSRPAAGESEPAD